MPIEATDLERLQETLALAEGAIGVTEPNPRVGCIVADARGHLVGRGATQQAGGPHAEVMALRQATGSGAALAGGTAWVTLEPCAHHGRTPPCCDALIEAGLARVVIGTGDPFPQVAGAGIARLRAAGIIVDIAEGAIASDCRELNIGFFSRLQRGRPWLRMKIAASLDGRTALHNGRSQWITGPEARKDGHRWRARACAILTGSGTVLADNPRMNVRDFDIGRQPLRVIVDSTLRTPADAAILPALIACHHADPAARSALEHAGAEVLELPGADGRVDLAALLTVLAQRGVNELHVEAGAALNGALLAAGLIDEWVAYVAPLAVGDSARGLFNQPALTTLAEAARFNLAEVRQVGGDLRLTLLPVA